MRTASLGTLGLMVGDLAPLGLRLSASSWAKAVATKANDAPALAAGMGQQVAGDARALPCGAEDAAAPCASEITSFTPRSPRRARLRRNSVQKVSASDAPIAAQDLAAALVVDRHHRDAMRPVWRTFT